jgi:hypothetical protein
MVALSVFFEFLFILLQIGFKMPVNENSAMPPEPHINCRDVD